LDLLIRSAPFNSLTWGKPSIGFIASLVCLSCLERKKKMAVLIALAMVLSLTQLPVPTREDQVVAIWQS
jgi:hypothetical protein